LQERGLSVCEEGETAEAKVRDRVAMKKAHPSPQLPSLEVIRQILHREKPTDKNVPV
jgi:hypothetical protein